MSIRNPDPQGRNTLDQYQDATLGYAVYPRAGTGEINAITYAVLGLVGEAGELANKLKKVYRDGNDPATLNDELGDVLWYVARVADELALNLSEVALGNLEKLESRAERGTIRGSGDER